MPIEILGKIINKFRILGFIRTFPLVIKYHLNPFTATANQLKKVLSKEDKEKFIASTPKRYREKMERLLK